MVLVSFIAVGALVVAGFIGQAMAHWLLTLPADGSVAGGGAMAVGAAFLILMYLVFASKQGRPGAAHGRR